MLKVTTNPLGLFLHAAQMAGSCLDPLQFRAGRGLGGHGLFDVGVGHLVGIQFRAVAGQVEHFDVVGVLGQPRLDRLAVMSDKER